MAGSLLVFDTGPLSHFAKAGWLGILKAISGDRVAVIPDVVESELRQGSGSNSFLDLVLDADWIGRRELSTSTELERFAHYSSFLVSKDRNQGEAAVLALAETSGGTAVIDDRAGRRVATSSGVTLTGTLGLLVAGIRGGLLTVDLVSSVADDLLASEYRYPFESGGFAAWAEREGLA